MFTAQQIASGFANIPAGFMTDFFRRQLPIILFSAMALVGLGYLLVGFTDWYWLLLIAAVIIGIGTSMWHAPAFGALAARYPKRRGFAMAAHLTGALNLGRLRAAERVVIQHATARKPGDRFPSCAALVEALRRAHEKRARHMPAVIDIAV